VSSGHRHTPTLRHAAQLDALLGEPWFVRCLERARRDVEVLYEGVDLPYVAGSNTELEHVYVDQHAYQKVAAAGLLPGLIDHELVEGILLRHGYNYIKEPLAAHMIASCAEDRCNEARGITRETAEAVYAPLEKADARERLSAVPIDLNMKPYLETASRSLLAHMGAHMTGNLPDDITIAGGGETKDAGKVDKASVDYGPAKFDSADHCAMCRYFEVLGPRQCLRVIGEIDPWYWCRLFERG
jgi:hypothetical protein